LPSGHEARESTQMIGEELGGVVTLDFVIGSEKAEEPWKDPQHLANLKVASDKWRARPEVGSVLSLADFMGTGEGRSELPDSRKRVAEMQFLYAMSPINPLKQFLSDDERWTRIAIRLPDLPSNASRELIREMQEDL